MTRAASSAEEDCLIGKFVGPYVLLHVLGRGQFSRVQLAINQQTQERVAIKILVKTSTSADTVQKEILIHKQLSKKAVKVFGSCKHVKPGIIQLLGYEEDCNYHYLIMSWAGGGELFDLIEPDIGLEENLAHYYFTQLIEALAHMHNLGIAHRDLKPENLLLNSTGDLFISDFGLSTLFKHENKTRMLTTPCGSPIYIAPEVLAGYYDGPSADIWSCGVILFVLLVGNTLWEKPSLHCSEYVEYRSGQFLLKYPWSHFPPTIKGTWSSYHTSRKSNHSMLDLILGMLQIDWQQRWTIDKVMRSTWYQRENPIFTVGIDKYLMEREKHRKSQMDTFNISQLSQDRAAFALSQPMDIAFPYKQMMKMSHENIISFSQPVLDKVTSAPTEAADFFKYAIDQVENLKTFASERLTRFFTRLSSETIVDLISQLLQSILIPFHACKNSHKILFSTVDKRKCTLKGTIYIRSLAHISNSDPGQHALHALPSPSNVPPPKSGLQLVVFQKLKGDAIEFKRFYKILLAHLLESQVVDTATSFSVAELTESRYAMNGQSNPRSSFIMDVTPDF